ncbi:hypothetical protein [Glaciecola sp. 1036]|uniref:hypothetical protein n=1 Tax=Alteromonadaceae TaxID=72275 RepID=UPI003D075AB1
MKEFYRFFLPANITNKNSSKEVEENSNQIADTTREIGKMAVDWQALVSARGR